MKVAIFGGTGFVGSYIIDELIKNKHKPIVLVRSASAHKLIQKDKLHYLKFITPENAAYFILISGILITIFKIFEYLKNKKN